MATSMAMSLASLTTGSEGGTRASGDARRPRKIRSSSPPSFVARDQRFPFGFERLEPNDDSQQRSVLLAEGIRRGKKKRRRKRNKDREPFILFHGLEQA